ncbi:MAG: virA, partial [Rhodospirillales bacterium]|nr:virA [Rhodospirillales bacterium]
PENTATATVDRLAESVNGQEDLTEQFKSKNALLQNSLAYFTLLSGNLESSDRGPFVPAVGPLAATTLRLTLIARKSGAASRTDNVTLQCQSPSRHYHSYKWAGKEPFQGG